MRVGRITLPPISRPAVALVPLATAVLCATCDAIRDSCASVGCPHCGDTEAYPVAKALGGVEGWRREKRGGTAE